MARLKQGRSGRMWGMFIRLVRDIVKSNKS